MNVLFHVQHLLGIGHLRRAALIARALVAEGAAVTVVQGGRPEAGADFTGVRVVPLPAARAADAAFSAILDDAGRPIDDAWKAGRRERLLDVFAAARWDAVLIETFPFGRRQFRFELEPLLEAAYRASPRPLVAGSVRDILVEKADPARHESVAATVRRWFDLVLVHGDPTLIPFDATFPAADRIADRLRYTGYVTAAAAADAPGDDGRDEIVVSVGGGAVGAPLLRAALAARSLSCAADARWRLLAGADLPAQAREEIRRSAPDGIVVEAARADFPALLRRCRLSISQAGYNTVMDVLAAGCRAVLVPFVAPGETEQHRRAHLLAAKGAVVAIDSLEPRALARAIDAALVRPPRPLQGVSMDGAVRSARLLCQAAGRASG